MDFLIIFLVAFASVIWGITLGWKARERHAMKIAQELLDGLEEKVEKQEPDRLNITIEKHGDCLYVFDRDSNQFMAQGKNREELESVLKQRFPGKTFAATQEDLGLL